MSADFGTLRPKKKNPDASASGHARPLQALRIDGLVDDFERAVIVAVIAVRVVQVAVDEVVDMIAVGHRLMPAAGAVDMGCVVAAAVVCRRALIGVLVRYLDHVLVHVVSVRMVQMAIVQIVHMVAVAHAGVLALRAVRMRMGLMMVVIAFGHIGLICLGCRERGRNSSDIFR